MEKVQFMPEGEDHAVDFYVLEEAMLGGKQYLFVTDSQNDDAEALILRANPNDDGNEVTFDVVEDEDELTVHIAIPGPELEPININEEDIEFGDVDRGLLGIGKMSMTPEESQEVVAEARNKMTEKLEEENTAEEAERFAKLSAWEIYQPIINTVTKGYSLEIDIKQ